MAHQSNPSEMPPTWDVVVVGAGMSGIAAAYRIKTGLPHLRFCILERRSESGGTWSFFQYPGLRSDSDLYTFGFPFKPWEGASPIASAGSILEYMRSTSSMHGLEQHIQYNTGVISADWSSKRQEYDIETTTDEKPKTIHARFILWASGYFDYNEPRKVDIPGIENFKGKLVHPQSWPADYDHTNKNLIVIGSGATAVTLAPSLAEKASLVTIVQRSPGYILSSPSDDPLQRIVRTVLPPNLAHIILRWTFFFLSLVIFFVCRTFPTYTKRALIKSTASKLPPHIPVDPHFTPNYNPWDQRLCVVPDDDLFKAFHSGKADIRTGVIDSVTETGLRLKNGDEVNGDAIVTATGLQLQLFGGAKISIDGKEIVPNHKLLYRGTMLQDVPNAVYVFGYTNVSFTMSSDLTARLAVRIIREMEKRQSKVAVVRFGKEEKRGLVRVKQMNLSSGYLRDVPNMFPRTATTSPWKPRANYLADWWFVNFGRLDGVLRFER